MNIKEAKEQISNAMKAYFTKDEFGNYVIPPEVQRPVFLMGPPGVGKTAIMKQVAEELGVSLVSYSMTHHTRQSALGLPFIVKKTYGGKEYDVSEYTMSEIIASVYDSIEETGNKEGILFLDEINCVSETLAPAMLQFLQYKIFGRHRVPEGWVVVTAGNPPEYNNSVREFDLVTWDRLKRIDVEPVYDVWKEYAYKSDVHAAVMTYLDIKKGDFYRIESTVDGKSFVTARGWSDLSEMIKLYEKNGIKVDEKLVSQYVQNKKIAKDFAVYYDLWIKYKSDYQVDKILEGKADEGVKIRAKSGKFDEKLSVLGLIVSAIVEEVRGVYVEEQVISSLLIGLRLLKAAIANPDSKAEKELEKLISEKQKEIGKAKSAGTLTQENHHILLKTISALENIRTAVISASPENSTKAFLVVKEKFDEMTAALKKHAASAGKKLSNVFVFCEEVFGEGQEILILVTELTISFYGAHFISRYGCEEYFKHNKELLFYERQKKIISEIENFDL